MGFDSVFRRVGSVKLPEFSGIRIMMMPIVIGDPESIPSSLRIWRDALATLSGFAEQHKGRVGYLTLDEKHVGPGSTHRRAGLHVDGVCRISGGGWAGEPPPGGGWAGQSMAGGWGGGGGWSSKATGMLTTASHVGCRAWNQRFEGETGPDGECEHLANQLREDAAEFFLPEAVYWVDAYCVHESIPQVKQVARQFVRLSLPSTAAWFEGYTENPLGIKPTGPILPRRKYMEAA